VRNAPAAPHGNFVFASGRVDAVTPVTVPK